MNKTELWVHKANMRETRQVTTPLEALKDGEIRVTIDKFALTSNNVSYGLSGNTIGYWHYFPSGEEDWGKITVWGLATVSESKSDDIAVGEQLYGFFPMSSHVTLTPGKVKPMMFLDGTDYRQPLPMLYNQYMRCDNEPAFLKSIDDERCLLFPLFITGYVIADFLMDNEWFGADQIIVGSVSSKTGIGTAAFIRENGFKGQVIGLTSDGNADFVKGLNICDQVVTYGDVESLAQVPSVYVDMSGSMTTRAALHNHLTDNMKSSQVVGATHWDNKQQKQDLPGAAPIFFFTPGQIDKRNKEWGSGVLMQKSYEASAKLGFQMKGQITINHHSGIDALNNLWNDMLDNKITGNNGLMISLSK